MLIVSDIVWLDIPPRVDGDGVGRSGRVLRSFSESFATLPSSPHDTSATLVLLTRADAGLACAVESSADLVRLAWLRSWACVGWWTHAKGEAGPFPAVEDALAWAWSHPEGVRVRALEPNSGAQDPNVRRPDSGTIFPHIVMPQGARTARTQWLSSRSRGGVRIGCFRAMHAWREQRCWRSADAARFL